MKKILLISACILAVATAGYLALPSPNFPAAPPGSLQSTEPADTESVFRRAYFTNLTREELMAFYLGQFGTWSIRQILPPEMAQELIRDQTRSSYLEELVHPARESLYVNAFVPIRPTDEINMAGTHYLNKVTVRYMPSSLIPRLTMLLLAAGAAYLLGKEYGLVK
ncbi:MAG: hypothetical protein Q7S31_01230 [bacterium]|nr:hypothetical protein [bacterium]